MTRCLPLKCRILSDGLLFDVFAALIAHGATGLARGLTGRLALAAAACLDCLPEMSPCLGFDSCHILIPLYPVPAGTFFLPVEYSILRGGFKVFFAQSSNVSI